MCCIVCVVNRTLHVLYDITAYTHTIYIYMLTGFDFTACNAKFINQMRGMKYRC